jgi:hypothetical protein
VFSIGCFRRLPWAAIAVGLAALALIEAGVAPASVAGSGGWKVQTSPNPGGSPTTDRLAAVAATSHSDAWAVGSYYNGTAYRTLVEHWNGKAWKMQRSPNPGDSGKSSGFSGVTATSSGNAWAVGAYTKNRGALRQTLIERFNGTAWKVQPSPNADPSQADNGLFDVAATSSGNAWAVGSYGALSRLDPPLVEQWNGKTWKIQPSSNFPDGVLFGVAAISSADAWAVGSYSNGTNNQSLILHCC